MHYLILDTCIWIYLAEEKYEGALTQLEKLVDGRKVTLLIPEQVLNEWNNGKADIIREHFQGSIKGSLKNAKSLSNYLNDEEKEILTKLIKSVDDKKEEYGGVIADKNITRVEKLIKFGVVCPTTPDNKIKATDIGLAKKAPFHKKNSTGDALIILSSIEYLENQGIREAYFISGNIKDFGAENNPTILHPHLTDLFDSVELQYSTNVKEVFKTVDKLIVSDEEIKEVEMINREMNFLEEAPNCSVCKTPMKGAYLRSQFGGLTWQWICPGHSRIDTGDFWD